MFVFLWDVKVIHVTFSKLDNKICRAEKISYERCKPMKRTDNYYIECDAVGIQKQRNMNFKIKSKIFYV